MTEFDDRDAAPPRGGAKPRFDWEANAEALRAARTEEPPFEGSTLHWMETTEVQDHRDFEATLSYELATNINPENAAELLASVKAAPGDYSEGLAEAIECYVSLSSRERLQGLLEKYPSITASKVEALGPEWAPRYVDVEISPSEFIDGLFTRYVERHPDFAGATRAQLYRRVLAEFLEDPSHYSNFPDREGTEQWLRLYGMVLDRRRDIANATFPPD